MKAKIFFLALLAAAITSCGDGSAPSMKLIPVVSGSDYGYIDWEGKIVINPQFSYAGLFKEDIARIRTSGNEPLFGYIDAKGSYVINPQFIAATDFQDGIAIVVKANEAPKGINKKGETVFEVKSAQSVTNFSDGLAAYSVESEKGLVWGFIDSKGATAVNPQFANVGQFSNGKCAVMNSDGKWGYIDKTGKILINPQFAMAEDFIGGKAIVYDNSGKAGLIDESGKYVINPQFSKMISDGNRFIIGSGGKIGWADAKGTIIINPQFDGAFPFADNSTAPVRQGDSWGYIDTEGKYVINPQFQVAYPFMGGKALVQSGGDVGIVDKKGSYLVNPQFGRLSDSFAELIGAGKRMQSVQSDYFDAASIANAIKNEITPTTVDGFTFSTPLSAMMAKYPDHRLEYYYGNSRLFENRQINKYASLSLSVEGTIYIQSGWSYVPNPEATVGGFTYLLHTSGKAVGKTEEILATIAAGMSGFRKIENPSSGQYQFASDTLLVTIGQIGGSIAIKITPAAGQEAT